MEEELAKALARKAENRNQNANIPNISATPMQTTKIFGANDAKRMSFDENMPYQQYSSSPLSSILSSSPGSYNQAGFTRERRDSLKNMWHLQDFATTD